MSNSACSYSFVNKTVYNCKTGGAPVGCASCFAAYRLELPLQANTFSRALRIPAASAPSEPGLSLGTMVFCAQLQRTAARPYENTWEKAASLWTGSVV